MSRVGVIRSERKRRWAWLIVGYLASCASPGKNGPAPKTVAAPGPAQPVDGEISPEPLGGIGPFDSPVITMAASEGTIAASAASSSTVRLFDARTGQPMGDLACPSPSVIGLRFSPDGKYLSAISQQQNEVYVWDVAARSAARTFRTPKKAWGAMPLSGGARVVVAGEQGMMVIAAIDTGQVVRSIPALDKGTMYGLGLSKSGRWLSAVADGRSLIVVDMERGDSTRVAEADTKMRLSASEFSPDDSFVIARGSSFGPPRMVEVGAHPEGAEPVASTGPSYSGCSAAIVATGLIGYALCAAIVSATAPAVDQVKAPAPSKGRSDDKARPAAGGPPDKQPTVDLAGMSGELMVWRLNDPQPIVVKAFGRTFEQMAWSTDSAKVALVTSGMQEGEMVKRVSIYQRSQISARSSTLPSPIGSVTLGRANNLLLGAIASDVSTVFMERSQPASYAAGAGQTVASAPGKPKFTIERWPLPALRTQVNSAARSP